MVILVTEGSLSAVVGRRYGYLIHTSDTAKGPDSSVRVWAWCHLGVVSVKDTLHFWFLFFTITFQSIGAQSCSHLFCATVLLKNLSLGFFSRRWGEAVINP